MQHELALRIYLEPVGAVKAEHDLLRVRSGCNDEVVFKLALVAVVEEINAGIDV